MPAPRWFAAALTACLVLLTTAVLPAAAAAAPAAAAPVVATPSASASSPAPAATEDPAGTTDEGGRVPTFVLLAFGAVVVVGLGLAATFLYQYRRADPPRR